MRWGGRRGGGRGRDRTRAAPSTGGRRAGKKSLGGVTPTPCIGGEHTDGDIAWVHIHDGLLATDLPEVQHQLGFV